MLSVWILENIYLVRSLLGCRVEEAVIEFSLPCLCLRYVIVQEEEQLEINRPIR